MYSIMFKSKVYLNVSVHHGKENTKHTKSQPLGSELLSPREHSMGHPWPLGYNKIRTKEETNNLSKDTEGTERQRTPVCPNKNQKLARYPEQNSPLPKTHSPSVSLPLDSEWS